MELSDIESCSSSLVFDPKIKKEREKESLTKTPLILVEMNLYDRGMLKMRFDIWYLIANLMIGD